MDKLNKAEQELVAIGAALGSNCVPCIEFHVPAARKAGLSGDQIDEAVKLADKVRQVPARKVLAAAHSKLAETEPPASAEQKTPDDSASEKPATSPCGEPVAVGAAEEPCCG